MHSADETFRLLFVCTANLCRSPMAQALFLHAVRRSKRADANQLHVESVGTLAAEGAAMDRTAAAAVGDLAASPVNFHTRALTPDRIDKASLVLCAERAHRKSVLWLRPAAYRRTFTILEFAELSCGADPTRLSSANLAERARSLVTAVAEQRSALLKTDLDLADPYGQGSDTVAACARQIAGALEHPLQLLLS